MPLRILITDHLFFWAVISILLEPILVGSSSSLLNLTVFCLLLYKYIASIRTWFWTLICYLCNSAPLSACKHKGDTSHHFWIKSEKWNEKELVTFKLFLFLMYKSNLHVLVLVNGKDRDSWSPLFWYFRRYLRRDAPETARCLGLSPGGWPKVGLQRS
jgi:hypothetical protein